MYTNGMHDIYIDNVQLWGAHHLQFQSCFLLNLGISDNFKKACFNVSLH